MSQQPLDPTGIGKLIDRSLTDKTTRSSAMEAAISFSPKLFDLIDAGDFTIPEKTIDDAILEFLGTWRKTVDIETGIKAFFLKFMMKADPSMGPVLKRFLALSPLLEVETSKFLLTNNHTHKINLMNFVWDVTSTRNAQLMNMVMTTLRDAIAEAPESRARIAERYHLDFRTFAVHALTAAFRSNTPDLVRSALSYLDLEKGIPNLVADIEDLDEKSIEVFDILVGSGWRASSSQVTRRANSAVASRQTAVSKFLAQSSLPLDNSVHLMHAVIHTDDELMFQRLLRDYPELVADGAVLIGVIYDDAERCLKHLVDLRGLNAINEAGFNPDDHEMFVPSEIKNPPAQCAIQWAITCDAEKAVKLLLSAGSPVTDGQDEGKDAVSFIKGVEAAGRIVPAGTKAIIQAAAAREILKKAATGVEPRQSAA